MKDIKQVCGNLRARMLIDRSWDHVYWALSVELME